MKRQRGVALITAMLITALVGSVALGLAWDNALDIRRTSVLLNRDQAVHIALGAEAWVSTILAEDLQDSETDHFGEIWATEIPGIPFEGGELFGRVEDLQGRFNINNLVTSEGEIDEASLDQFRRLLQALGLDPRFAGIAADWLDADQEPQFPDGAEDTLYSTRIPPLRTADRRLSDVSELASLDGMDKTTMDVLLPHVTALPGRTRLNVNTATPAVLQSLSESMSAGDVERLIEERADAGFTDVVASFQALVEPEVLNELTESSQYFQLKASVRVDTVRISFSSLYLRSPQGGIVPILRSLGSLQL